MRGGYREGAGRKPSVKTQAKRWEEANPGAYDELMQSLYEKALEGDRESAVYVIDRLKGKPRQQTDINIDGGESVGSKTLLDLFTLMSEERRRLQTGETKLITEGNEPNKFYSANQREG